MADDKKIRGSQDRKRINLNEDYEVRYWTEELGITNERLRELVQQHGDSADEIREALNRAA